MKLLRPICLLVAISARLEPCDAWADEQPRVSVVTAEQLDPLEQHAAEQLCHYIRELFKVETKPSKAVSTNAEIVLLIGSPATNPAIAELPGSENWPKISEQGIVLKRTTLNDKPALIVGGGSPVATLWAVYELVERWGVRYLLHGDVLPENPGLFRLPESDIVMEPKFPVRQWRVINDFACGPESWGIADYRPVLDQLAKLKFNRIYAVVYPWQPFIDLKHNGIERKQAWLWYDFHYPISDDMPGRRLFGDIAEWWNPDLPRGGDYAAAAEAGQRHVQAILRHARSRGMQVTMSVNLAECPKEFAPLLQDHRVIYAGLGNLSVTPGPGQPIDDPKLQALSVAVLQATVDTYPEVDFLAPGLPEIPHWTDGYERAWQTLDGKYDLQSRFPVQQMITAASNRHGYAGGLERAVHEVKSNIVALYLIDKLIREQNVLAKTARPDARIMFNSMAEEVLPVLPHALPPGSETLNLLDYTPDRIVNRPGGFELGRGSPMRHNLIFTLHDDNVGLLPMLNTGSLATIADHMQDNGWAGFSTRYWLISDHDPCVAFIAKRSWDDEATPESVYRDQITAVSGSDALPDLLTMLAELETVTVKLNQQGMGLTFPVGRGMIEQHLRAEPLPAHLVEWREHYRRALAAARAAHEKSTDRGKPYTAYWMGRLQFGAGYFDCAEAARTLASAKERLKQAQSSGDAQVIADRRAEVIDRAEKAVQIACETIEAFARVARDQSDRGTIAVLGEYVYQPLKDQLDKSRQ